MNATHWETLKTAAKTAANDKNLTRASGGWDCLSAFADSMGMTFPSGARENILRLVALDIASAGKGKGKFSGGSARWSSGYKFAPAWREYIAGATGDAQADRRDERTAFVQAARLYAACGGASFLVIASEE